METRRLLVQAANGHWALAFLSAVPLLSTAVFFDHSPWNCMGQFNHLPWNYSGNFEEDLSTTIHRSFFFQFHHAPTMEVQPARNSERGLSPPTLEFRGSLKVEGVDKEWYCTFVAITASTLGRDAWRCHVNKRIHTITTPRATLYKTGHLGTMGLFFFTP